MIFSRIRPNATATPADLAHVLGSSEYGHHRLLWHFFGDHPDRTRDFLYRADAIRGLPTFYVVSARPPVPATPAWDVVSKPYAPVIHNGDYLQFSLRANPVYCPVAAPDQHGQPRHRHDVVMHAKRTSAAARTSDPAALIQNVGVAWLQRRASALGFRVSADSVRADGYCQHILRRHPGTRTIRFSTIEYTGLLTVTDAECFTQKALLGGVGPCKAFGCGLLLIRRP